MTTPKKQPKKATAIAGSSADFQTFMFGAQPEWSLWAVEAPLNIVADEFARLSDGSVWAQNILATPPKKKGAELVSMVPIVQLKNSSWVVGFRSVGWFMEQHFGVPEEAEHLSRKLKTRSISFIREDTSGSVDLRLFDSGKMSKKILTEGYPASVERMFRELGLYLPACMLYEDSKTVFLTVEPESKDRVEEAYIVLLSL